jgi:hypothetical protein
MIIAHRNISGLSKIYAEKSSKSGYNQKQKEKVLK